MNSYSLSLLLFFLIVSCSNQLSSPEEPHIAEVDFTDVLQTETLLPDVKEDPRTATLREKISLIEKSFNGDLAVYIKNLDDGFSLSYNAENDRYFASTTKIPIAIAILQRVQQGELSLSDELILCESDYVDGNGDILWQQPGSVFTVGTLLEKMIQDSDNCSTDMLVRLIGQNELNKQVQQMIPAGINPITTILQVRHDAFSEIHKNALSLTNMEILSLNSIPSRTDRFKKLQELLSVSDTELQAVSIEEAFEKYYLRGLNSGKLESMGLLLERLYNEELLAKEHTKYLIEVMNNINTGQRRIKAGLPPEAVFAQKTGTQISNLSNAGIILTSKDSTSLPIVVVVNAKYSGSINQAENAMMLLGQLITDTFLQ